jgi:heat shock protein HtpX
MTAGSYFAGGNAILAISHAREIKKSDDPQLFNVVEELSLAAGQPIPKIYVIDDTAMNAFATGRNPKNACVAITLGLRQKLKRDELQGVMAHEMSHIRNYDILYATMMAVMVGCLVMLCDIFLRSVFWGSVTGGRRRRSNNDNGGGAGQIIMLVVAILLAILAPILAKIVQMSLSRQREYLADAGAVELTRNPDGLSSALVRLTEDNEVLEAANRATAPLYIVNPIKKFEERSKNIFDTHPSIKDRVKRLKSLTA